MLVMMMMTTTMMMMMMGQLHLNIITVLHFISMARMDGIHPSEAQTPVGNPARFPATLAIITGKTRHHRLKDRFTVQFGEAPHRGETQRRAEKTVV